MFSSPQDPSQTSPIDYYQQLSTLSGQATQTQQNGAQREENLRLRLENMINEYERTQHPITHEQMFLVAHQLDCAIQANEHFELSTEMIQAAIDQPQRALELTQQSMGLLKTVIDLNQQIETLRNRDLALQTIKASQKDSWLRL